MELVSPIRVENWAFFELYAVTYIQDLTPFFANLRINSKIQHQLFVVVGVVRSFVFSRNNTEQSFKVFSAIDN